MIIAKNPSDSILKRLTTAAILSRSTVLPVAGFPASANVSSSPGKSSSSSLVINASRRCHLNMPFTAGSAIFTIALFVLISIWIGQVRLKMSSLSASIPTPNTKSKCTGRVFVASVTERLIRAPCD